MITDIRYKENGYLHGKLLGVWEISGKSLNELKNSAKESIEAYGLILALDGKSMEQGLLELIDNLYGK